MGRRKTETTRRTLAGMLGLAVVGLGGIIQYDYTQYVGSRLNQTRTQFAETVRYGSEVNEFWQRNQDGQTERTLNPVPAWGDRLTPHTEAVREYFADNVVFLNNIQWHPASYDLEAGQNRAAITNDFGIRAPWRWFTQPDTSALFSNTRRYNMNLDQRVDTQFFPPLQYYTDEAFTFSDVGIEYLDRANSKGEEVFKYMPNKRRHTPNAIRNLFNFIDNERQDNLFADSVRVTDDNGDDLNPAQVEGFGALQIPVYICARERNQ